MSMSLSIATAKISSKGQITLPAAMRRKLATDRVSIRMEGDKLTIEPQRDLGGSLAKYARGKPNLKRETEDAWAKHLDEKFGRR